MKKNLIIFTVLFTYSLSSFAIRNGIEIKLEDGKFPNAVMIKSVMTCSGVRIAFDMVLTVNHCVEKTHSNQKKFYATYLDGNELRRENIPYTSAKKNSKQLNQELIVFPINPKAPKESFKPDKVLDLINGTDAMPDQLIIAGFGVNAEGNNTDEVLRFGRGYFDKSANPPKEGEILEIGINAIPETKKEDIAPCPLPKKILGSKEIDILEKQLNDIEFEGKENQVVCKGDSGGPVYGRTISGELILIGVQSRSAYSAKLNLRNASDKKYCQSFFKSYAVPVSSFIEYLNKNEITINLYKL